ncbi:MAG: Gfo/Idh/MocA family oxidoreductase [Planctomycetota bacterium]|nr:Gfo/Idh/MocA family oxidoreductase [Planctomycetota bacterium]
MARWKIAGINFDHFHMGDNLRAASEHPDAEIVALCDEDPARMRSAAQSFGVPSERVYTDVERCLEEAQPDVIVLCPAAARHGEWTRRVAPSGAHVVVEKPFAATLAEADDMLDAMSSSAGRLMINWPLAWVPSHRTAKRLVDEGTIGEVLEVHYYDGNRGPLWHGADKLEKTAAQVAAEKPSSWFYQRAHGGGSQLDYLGYGTTLGTWYLGGRKPIEVTSVVDRPEGLEVDEHSITVARYAFGLSKFETRWGTFSDPWTHQPQPGCGFVLKGSEGTIASYDYQPSIRVQTCAKPEGFDVPSDTLAPEVSNPIAFLLDALEHDRELSGPCSPAIARIGQQIVDSAVRSAQLGRTVELLGE